MTGCLLLTLGVLTLLAPPVESHDTYEIEPKDPTIDYPDIFPDAWEGTPLHAHPLSPSVAIIQHPDHEHSVDISALFGGNWTSLHPDHFEIQWIRVYKNPATMSLKDLREHPEEPDPTAGTAKFVRGFTTDSGRQTNYVVTPPDFKYRRARLFSSFHKEHADLDAGKTKLEDEKDKFFWVKIDPGGGPSDPTSGGLVDRELADGTKDPNSGLVTATEHTTVVPGDIVAIAVNVKLTYYKAVYDFLDPRFPGVTARGTYFYPRLTSTERDVGYVSDKLVVDMAREGHPEVASLQVTLPLFFKEGRRAPDKNRVWVSNLGFKLASQPNARNVLLFDRDPARQRLLDQLAGGAIIAAMWLPGNVGILNPNYPLEHAATKDLILHGDIDRSLTHKDLEHDGMDGYHTLVYQFEVTADHFGLNTEGEWLTRSARDGNVNPFNMPYKDGVNQLDYAWATFNPVPPTGNLHEERFGFWVPFLDEDAADKDADGNRGVEFEDFLDATKFIANAPYSLKYRHHARSNLRLEGPATYGIDLFDPNRDGILDFILPIERWEIPNTAYDPVTNPSVSKSLILDRYEGDQEIGISAPHYTVRDRSVKVKQSGETIDPTDMRPGLEPHERRTIILDLPMEEHEQVQTGGFYDATGEFAKGQPATGSYFRHHLPPTYNDAAKEVIYYPTIREGYVAAMTEIVDVPSETQTGPFTLTVRFREEYADGGQGAPGYGADVFATLQTALSAGLEDGTVAGVSHLGVTVDGWRQYQVTVVPALGFAGELTFAVPADTVVAGSGLGNLASAAVTVPIDPLVSGKSVEVVAPEGGAYLAGSEITVEVPFAMDGLTFEGENPPYVTIYLGEQGATTARHATWQKGEERSGSTIVPFAYVLQASDPPAASVSVDLTSLSVPRETTLKSASGMERVGTAAPAVAPGEAAPLPDTPSAPAQTFDVPVTPVVYIPQDDTVSKAVASDVPRSPIVFNELGNGSEDANDWLEFRNVSGSDVSLKDWELSVVQDGKKEETSLIVFPDVSVPANGLLLITNMPADKTPLAGGENKGLSHASLVDAGLSLPDDGKFLLILRNAKEKLGLDEAFIDVAGGGGSDTDAFIRDETDDYDTYVWPLQVLEAPGDATEDALSSGKVWQRAKADIIGYHQAAWAEAAFTGIGYDRKVTRSAATAGTPGYPNGAVKTAASTPKGAVTISEIMFDSDRGKLPQWIELYNKSKTEALNLDRWQLEIQNRNSEDLIGRPIVTLTLKEKVIQPNQTLLIVAGDARASSADVFPEDRVYNLLELHEKNLRIKTPRDTFLSGEGFYLKLSDRNGTKIDEVGNIDDNRRTDDAPVWVWPTNRREGPRSSVVRRYDKGSDARDGMLKSNWALSANFNRFKVESLHYGHADDIGTPGYRQGGALPVELSSFKVTRTDEGPVIVTWTTESEVDNAGFNLRRSLTRDNGFTLLNPVLIAGAGTTGERQTYTFTDTSAKPGVEYYYQIEEVSLGGRPETLRTRRLPGPVSPANRALTTFGEVKQRE